MGAPGNDECVIYITFIPRGHSHFRFKQVMKEAARVEHDDIIPCDDGSNR